MANNRPQEFRHFEITDKEFEHFRELIYQEAGINLTPAKRCLVQTRIGKLMRRRNINGFKQLFSMLENDDTGQELISVVDAICTNHTYFFRENEHFNYLTEHIIPDLVNNQNKKIVRIWSAGCSTGEEPYSIAISLNEVRNHLQSWKFNVFASDLSTKALKTAARGIYEMETIRPLSDELKKKYFQRGKGRFSNLVKVKDNVKLQVEFKRHNLLNTLDNQQKFDVIFCRNVMIYFDQDTKTKVVHRVGEKLNEGGYFITGHSESLNMIEHPYTMVKPTIYKLA